MKIIKLLDASEVVLTYDILDFKKWHTGYYLKINIQLIDNSSLFIREYCDEIDRHYSYHWQDENSHLICRWDNSPHYRYHFTFPHHKHFGNEIIASKEIIIEEVLNFIEQEIKHS